MKQSRGFSLIEVLVLVAVVAMISGGVFIWTQRQDARESNNTSIRPTPTPSLTADWKTHENELYSLKYPSDWQVESPTALQTNIVGENAVLAILVSETGRGLNSPDESPNLGWL